MSKSRGTWLVAAETQQVSHQLYKNKTRPRPNPKTGTPTPWFGVSAQRGTFEDVLASISDM